ncbi:MAG: helix-turn-helix domain-containing protein [Proteobacteria bacterium]|nr:helix-turn-helix domain-containing protein [Pseudomonadota bacterium]MBU1547410.1 helix-turn-helix domain-containing protein [Pseudomonadota bacterium]MBU2618982.1 helix-turn-helix domain-containing protein [Pseudomonadota bacterium]
MDSTKPLAGGVPMVNIDGARIRRLREEKGLTQLYVATVVGVTTDTISRWENRRYPNIKKENALKLAEALETQVADIVDHGQPASPTEPSSPQNSEPPKQDEPLPQPPEPEPSPALAPAAPQAASFKARFASFPVPVRLAGFFLLALAILAFLRWYGPSEGESQVAAYRIVPEHATPGIPFPVVIEVTTSATRPFSLILKETLPPACIPAQGKPRFVSQASDPPVLKWIDKISGEQAVYSYLAKLQPETEMETGHQFSGGVTVRSDDNPSIPVSGTDSLQASPFHWADSNSDGRIDDEELLSVYEIYGGIEGLQFGKKLIEEIWTAKGYRWNQETRGYDILH